ncbi:AlpA family phage regulatory protein [Ammonicoccus fulvus]|uniref:AlpA family phage regulatory protein n=1 Tax=Ammonicoccus fulvus TaxID=3138240 RepID=A0ABZ3FPX7_9ACTN
MTVLEKEPSALGELLTTGDVSAMTGGLVSESTLRFWRHMDDGRGPRWFKVGPRRVAYRRADVEQWLTEQYNGGAA